MTKVVATNDDHSNKYDYDWKVKYNEYKDKPDSWLTEQKYYVSSKVVKWINVRPFASKGTTADQGHPGENVASCIGRKQICVLTSHPKMLCTGRSQIRVLTGYYKILYTGKIQICVLIIYCEILYTGKSQIRILTGYCTQVRVKSVY